MGELTLTYQEVGATREPVLPAGYRHLERRVQVGAGGARFAAAREAVFGWAMQRAVGFAVTPGGAPVVGVDVALRRFGFVVPCRVVWVVDEADRAGFGYGTLPGHPESGEEAFVVERDADGAVWFDVRAFSRAATWYARAGGPVTWWVQRWATERYLRSV